MYESKSYFATHGDSLQKEDYTRVIYDKGCLRAGEEWVERNLVPVAGVAVAVSVLQVPGAMSGPPHPLLDA